MFDVFAGSVDVVTFDVLMFVLFFIFDVCF